MIRSRPGSVAAAARSSSTPSMNAVRRGGPTSGAPDAAGGADRVACAGTAGAAAAAWAGGAALPFDVSVT
ncbi:hypothetical protein GCM10010344_20110 [Streptomyces bluensis]|nr:hypothetical protein GCM10010344_20110 [Streptomyces bluensis]